MMFATGGTPTTTTPSRSFTFDAGINFIESSIPTVLGEG
jgi:hypothetical protein